MGVEPFELRVGDAAKLRVGLGGLGAVGEADEVDQPVAAIDLVAQHLAQIARLGAKDILPLGFVAQPGQNVGGQLPRVSQFAGGCRNENAGIHRLPETLILIGRRRKPRGRPQSIVSVTAAVRRLILAGWWGRKQGRGPRHLPANAASDWT